MTAGFLEINARPARPGSSVARLAPFRQALLLTLCLLWFLPGLTGRSLWKPTETDLVPAAAESFAEGWGAAVTNLGVPVAGQPPAYLYVGSLFGDMLSPAFEYHEGMRIANLLWLVFPLALAGTVMARRHGSRVGWRMVLLVMSSLGLLLHARTVNPDVTLLLLGTAGVFGLSRMRDDAVTGGLAIGLAGALLFWCVGAVAAWYVLALMLLPMGRLRAGLPGWSSRGVLVALALAALGVAAWVAALRGTSDAALSAAASKTLADLSPAALASSARKVILSAAWVTWPALPFAAMSFIRWRHGGRHGTEVPDGLIALAAGFAALVLSGSDRDSVSILLLPAAAYMSVAGMQDLTREVAKIHDRFAFVVIGGGMIGFFWLSWVAVNAGWPAGMVEWLEGLGVREGASGLPVFFAAVASVAWIALMLRIGRSPERAVINWMAGITMSWLMFTLLWMPEVDRAKDYGPVASSISEALPADYGCVSHEAVGIGLVAQIAYLSGVEFSGGDDCGWLLTYAHHERKEPAVWSGMRVGDDPFTRLSLHRTDI